MMEQETLEEAKIVKIFALDFFCCCETCVLSSECPGQHCHYYISVLSRLHLILTSFILPFCHSAFFPSYPHLTFSFQMNPSFPVVVTYLTLSSLMACALSLCL